MLKQEHFEIQTAYFTSVTSNLQSLLQQSALELINMLHKADFLFVCFHLITRSYSAG